MDCLDIRKYTGDCGFVFLTAQFNSRVVNEMSVSQAVKIIQTAERGRQGLLRAKLMKVCQ
jgi:hypothetical protein